MQKGFTIWLTGMSGAGKSTLSQALVERLRLAGEKHIEVLDGDEVREYLSKGLGFSKEDRDINVRRIGYVCSLLARNRTIAMAAAISPYRDIRGEVRSLHAGGGFLEVYMKADLDKLVERDVKGLYKKALAGEIPNFTGVSDPYEEPEAPEVIARTGGEETVEESVSKVVRAAQLLGYLEPGEPLTPELEDDVVGTLRAAGYKI